MRSAVSMLFICISKLRALLIMATIASVAETLLLSRAPETTRTSGSAASGGAASPAAVGG